jgi:hypothetical protein
MTISNIKALVLKFVQNGLKQFINDLIFNFNDNDLLELV